MRHLYSAITLLVSWIDIYILGVQQASISLIPMIQNLCCGLPQVLWLDAGQYVWTTTDSDQFFINLALRSTDLRYDGKRPRIRVRLAFKHSFSVPFLDIFSLDRDQKPSV